ncbi:MAG: Zn-ribbon domain-containing OB-fold protein [Deltaproteobacteria bacterium]|nr:Zn-ribbon domain-containing OB-fold protein [Deltaproteobacteria bacterium]
MAEKKEVDARFKKFGTVSFTSLTKTNDFITNLEEGKVTGTKCKVCGMVFFPPRADWYNCLSSDMEWFNVTGTGKLVTYSKLQYAPVGFEGDLPYSIALLDYGAYKVFGRLAADVPAAEVKVGMEMKAAPNHLPNGQINSVFHTA